MSRTPYYIEIFDAAGKKATGYIGAVGAGETLGSELVINGGMETGNPPTGWSILNIPEIFEQSNVQKHSGSYSAHIIDSIPSYGGFYRADLGLSNLKLYRILLWYYLVDGIGICQNQVDWNIDLITPGSWIYAEKLINPGNSFLIFSNVFNTVACEFYIDDASVKQITDPPATGVHIVSSLNGTTRNWASIESGFDPNMIASWSVTKQTRTASLNMALKIEV